MHEETPGTRAVAPDPTLASSGGASATAEVTAGVPEAGSAPPPGFGYRWTICALLFFATTINYVDRQVLGVLAPTLSEEIGWNEIEYGYIVTSFQAAYAIGLLLVGSLMDRVGTRVGFALAVVVWSLAGAGHALARTVTGFAIARFFLALGEAGNFPGAIKTVAEWFPKRERALATGIFNAGVNVGAVVAPLAVPWIALTWGWQWAFILTGAIGFVWLGFWLAIYRPPQEHPRLSQSELAYIQSGPPEPTAIIPWSQLLPHRQTLGFVLVRLLTDPVWWFLLYWLPKFLHQEYGLTLDRIGPPLVVIYLMADVGSIGGGWLSGALLKRGWTVNAARKTALLICAISVVPVVFASRADNLWVAVGLVGLAAAGHQGWSANMFTTVSDLFPRRAVGSLVGLGGMAGAISGMFAATMTGYLLEWTGSYSLLFGIAGFAYVVALGVFHLFVPGLEPVPIDVPSRHPGGPAEES